MGVLIFVDGIGAKTSDSWGGRPLSSTNLGVLDGPIKIDRPQAVIVLTRRRIAMEVDVVFRGMAPAGGNLLIQRRKILTITTVFHLKKGGIFFTRRRPLQLEPFPDISHYKRL